MLDHDDLPFAETRSPLPGLLVCRRGLFASVAAACAATGLPGASPHWQERRAPDDGFTIEEFVRSVTPVCKELLADRSQRGQDRYLLTLAAFAVRLATVPVPESREVKPGHRIGSNHDPEPFTVLHWQLERGIEIAPHAHTYGNVVTLGLTGSALVANYETVAPPDFDSQEDFVVQRTVEQVLRPGDVNLVNLERHYVHGFVAGPDGASGLDITTRIRERRRAPLLEVGEAIEGGLRQFRARWRQS
ncbi:MAG: hypothetical protein IT457_06115 [Planctomycetes bacterium]|nr:hypothetical protein [Planctomycetota bacterium]